MTITITSDLAEAAGLTEQELRIELAVALCREQRLTTAQGARLAGLNRFDFQALLAGRHVPSYDYDELAHDLATIGRSEPDDT